MCILESKFLLPFLSLSYKEVSYPLFSSSSINFYNSFNRLDFPDLVMKELIQKIGSLENIKCCGTNQSLHIYRSA